MTDYDDYDGDGVADSLALADLIADACAPSEYEYALGRTAEDRSLDGLPTLPWLLGSGDPGPRRRPRAGVEARRP